ncbi:MAG: hypothetical protein FVQ83_04260 [Chloroflexi bacterium]|nr:hypothetical protein [Chloroflexota bacterium]
MNPVIEKLLNSQKPSIRYKALVNVLGHDPDASEIKQLQEEIHSSQRVGLLLSERGKDGCTPQHAYSKWDGAHWILATLADLSYPPGDQSLEPLREQALEWLFSSGHEKHFAKRTIADRVRMHPSQEGNAIHYLLKLGLADERVEKLVERVLSWQWPDGGWNCDMNPETSISSFMETLIPLRGLALFARTTGDNKAKEVTERSAEIFLKRNLYKRQQDGAVMNYNFVKLHYPCYWHYDILFGLKVMAEAGYINDKRCTAAISLLESKRLPDGGFPAEAKYYRVTDKSISGRSLVDWGGTSKKQMNEFVTVDALSVLNDLE